MTNEQNLAAAIRESRQEGSCPPELRASLMAEVRKSPTRWPLWGAGALAAALAIVFLMPRQQVPVATPQLAPHPVASVVEPVREPAIAPEVAAPVRARKTPRATKKPSERIVTTPFFALDAGMIGERPRGYLMRVQVPRAAMASFGLPVNVELLDQRVDADVLLGSDGSARAIRFVRAVQ